MDGGEVEETNGIDGERRVCTRDGFLLVCNLFSFSFKISFLIILTLVHIRDSSYTAPTVCDLEPPYRVASGDCRGSRTEDGGGEDAAK